MTSRPTPEISVVIPHLNQPELLRKCLSSLRGQSFERSRFEIIVVDNGSSEMPEALCVEFGARLERETAPGPGLARNKGIGVSRAPILAFIDSDCIADREWLAELHKAFEDPGVKIIAGDVRLAIVDPDRMTSLEAYESIYGYRQKEYVEKKGFSVTANLAARREVFEIVGFFGGIAIAEDLDWGQRARSLGVFINYLPSVRIFHPARTTFAALVKKWDRHVVHEFNQQVSNWRGRAHWLAKMIGLALSPTWEFIRILRSRDIEKPADRLKAWMVLARIRLFRFRKMAALLLSAPRQAITKVWNR